jgi:hypothetical protein
LELFRPARDLNEFGFKEKNGYWGYLKFLFVNFEMYKSKIEQKNKNIREILLDILNEMSSAVNSFWNFQIVEGEESGNIIITVIDENFIGQNPNTTKPVTFRHVGNGSVFLDANIDISIPAEMTNQIVATRLGNSSNPDEAIVSTSQKSFFESSGDLFITAAPASPPQDPAPEPAPIPAGFENTQAEIDSYEAAIKTLNAERDAIKDDRGGPNTDRRRELYQAIGIYQRRIVETKARQRQETSAAETAAVEAAATTLTANLAKVTVVPLSKLDSLVGVIELNDQTELTNFDILKQNFMIYTFDDTEYLDRLKREAFSNKKSETLSHPLPIKYSFKILGNSGIRRGDMFNIDGIPEKYAKHGLFQVTQIEHSLDGNQWFTNITGDYRQIQ